MASTTKLKDRLVGVELRPVSAFVGSTVVEAPFTQEVAGRVIDVMDHFQRRGVARARRAE